MQGTNESTETTQGGLKLTALSIRDVSTLLTRAGGASITEEMIRKDTAAGAPVNPDGTINLVHYSAWSVQQRSRRGG